MGTPINFDACASPRPGPGECALNRETGPAGVGYRPHPPNSPKAPWGRAWACLLKGEGLGALCFAPQNRNAQCQSFTHSVNEARQARSAWALWHCPEATPKLELEDPELHCPLTHHRGLRGGTHPKSKFRSNKTYWGI